MITILTALTPSQTILGHFCSLSGTAVAAQKLGKPISMAVRCGVLLNKQHKV